MRIVQFPLNPPTDRCAACGQSIASHVVRGRAVGCRRDITIGRDQMTLARRLRLARLQRRVPLVQPFGLDLEWPVGR